MHPKIILAITRDTQRRFPEFAGVQPKVRKQPVPKGQQAPSLPRYLVTFETKVNGPGGVMIPRWLRIVADIDGKIIKTTTSK